MPHPLKFLLLLFAFAPCMAVAQIQVRVVSAADGRGVKGKVVSQVGGLESEADTDDHGTKTFRPLSCASGVKFRAKTGNPLWLAPRTWAPCDKVVTIRLQPSAVASVISPLIYPASALERPFDEAAFKIAARTENWAEVAYWAARLSRRFHSAGRPEQAINYELVATETGLRLVADRVMAAGGHPSWIGSRAVSMGTLNDGEIRELLRTYQQNHCLSETGEWDLPLFESLKRPPDSSECRREDGERG